MTLTLRFLIIGTLGNEVIFLKWSRAEFLQSDNGTIVFDDGISFEPKTFAKMNQIKGLQDVTVSGSAHFDMESNRVIADLDIEGVMIVPCAITMEDVEISFQTSSTETFAFDKCEDEDVHEAKGDVVELLPVIFQLILMEVPLKAVKEGIEEYPKGKSWEVVKEEDYAKAKRKEIDPRLAKLKEFKVEE